MPRSRNGWIPRFISSWDGEYNGDLFEMMPSGLQAAGVLFAQNYLSQNFGTENEDSTRIQERAEEFF